MKDEARPQSVNIGYFAGETKLSLTLGSKRAKVERPPNRRQNNPSVPYPLLNLNLISHIQDTHPVRPIDPGILHVINGYTVDEHGDIFLCKATQVDAGVAPAAPFPRSIGRGRQAKGFCYILRTPHLPYRPALQPRKVNRRNERIGRGGNDSGFLSM